MIERKFVDLYAQNAQGGLAVAERDVILTYALKILSDKRLLDKMVFKGGTCLRKNYFGKTTRFSLDLDFTNLDKRKPDDIILEVASIFNKTYFGIRFKIETKDFYVSEDGFSCGATINYAHSWNEASFNFELSLREAPVLSTDKLPILPQSYLKHLEFKPPMINCFSLEELLSAGM
jgi:predicted nucleotidyltransferase component of viral defense system